MIALPLAQSTNAPVFAGGVVLFVWILGIALFIFWLWMLIDCLGSAMPTTEKLLWVVLMIFLPVIGSILYFFLRRQGARMTPVT